MPNRCSSRHNDTPTLHPTPTAAAVQRRCFVGEDIYSLPGAAFAKKGLMQRKHMPMGRRGRGGHVFRWWNLCRSSCEKASAIHVWAENQGKQPCEKKLIRRGLRSRPPPGFTLWLKAASLQVLTCKRNLRLPNVCSVMAAKFPHRCGNMAQAEH